VHYLDNKVFDIIDARCNHEIDSFIYKQLICYYTFKHCVIIIIMFFKKRKTDIPSARREPRGLEPPTYCQTN